LAGLSELVLARARSLLATLEGRGPAKELAPRGVSSQLDLFCAPRADAASGEIRTLLKDLDLDRLTGIEALQLLGRLKALTRE
jgi:DNA mismatch repair ATPase MutS